jgi:tetrachlorobenzoquinone reductase
MADSPVLEAAAPAPAAGRPKPAAQTLRVQALNYEADGVVTVAFAAPGGGALPAWAPGAHVDVHLARNLIRQYSLCGDPADTQRWTVGVRLDEAGRGGSRFIHEQLRVGALVEVAGPRQNFALVPADDYVFVAGGIGITPLLPMVRQAAAAGARWSLHYAGRSRSRMPFLDQVGALGGRARVYAGDEGDRLDLAAVLGGLDPAVLVYGCGPERMLREAASLLAEGRLRTEQFAAKPVELWPSAAGPAAGLPGEPADEAFEVELASTGEVIAVPAGQSALDALEAAGANVMWSCREGTCGTCETGVTAGRIDHRDAILTEDERAVHDVFFPCVSRAASGCPRLTLDL